MNLVIVESPSKTKTIGNYLGSNYKVVSSKGHIRDLATTGKYGLGIDIENNFKPNYTVIKGKSSVIKELKSDAKKSDMVYLATDPDREGEAISWHLKDALGIDDKDYERVVFNEITHDAVINAFKTPRKIDENLVKSQETRRMLDRIIGFRLSKLMQSKTGGKSAGRVQSVALKLIVDREREINAFNPEEYWTISAIFPGFNADLDKYKNKKIEISNEDEANNVLSSLGNDFKVTSVVKKEKNRKGVMPFTTSTLQQACANKLNFGASKTMRVAQKLYESVDLGKESVGLITYMRTDSTRLSNMFIDEAHKFIEENYGKKYIGAVKKSKEKANVQDAHEAIRPTSLKRTPESVKEYLTNDEYKVYSIIYARALASLMADGKILATTILLDNNNYEFKATGQIECFDGYLKVYRKYVDVDDVVLPDIEEGTILNANEIKKEQHFTKPPARFTESSLIKELEALGIGRPSTYAKILEVIKERAYVRLEDKKFVPTEVGIETTDKLQEFFSSIINVDYTANMENDLDLIAENKEDYIKVLKEFYGDFEPLVKKAFDEMEKKAPVVTGDKCPNCGSDLVIRTSRYGKFTACSNYPTCKYIKQEEKKIEEVCDCPNCDGKIVVKRSKRGKVFYGCNNYPRCKTALWDEPTGEKCPKCGNLLVFKGKDRTIKCNSCDYTK